MTKYEAVCLDCGKRFVKVCYAGTFNGRCQKCDGPTPETDRYKGTHETHRIGGLDIYGHAREMENQRNLWMLQHDLQLQAFRTIRRIIEKGGTTQDVLHFLGTPDA